MKKVLLKSMMLLCLLFVGMGAWADEVTETFEKQSAGTTYNGQITYEAISSNAGISWYVEHGTVSTSSFITGSKSMHMRAYYAKNSAAGTWNGALPYVETKNPIKGLQSFTFNAAVSNTGIKMDVYYSTDGSSWTQIGTTKTFSNTTAANAGTFDIPSSNAGTNYYIKIAASSSSTHVANPSNTGNYTFRIDDVTFTYTAATTAYTVTFNGNNHGTPAETSLTEASAGAGITLPGCTADAGYSFKGWADASYATSANVGVAGASYKPTDNVTLYAFYVPTYTLTITQPSAGGTLTVSDANGALATGATVEVGTNLTCEVTNIPEGKRFSRFYVTYDGGENKYKGTNPATFDNIPTSGITAAEVTVTYMDIPQYTINYMVNGVNTSAQENVWEGTALVFPTPSAIAGKSFMGWSETEIDGTTDEAPSFVNTDGLTATANKTYYAVFANVTPGDSETKTDVLTRATTGVADQTGGTIAYTDWNNKSDASNAVYSGNSAGDKNTINLRSKNNNSGIVSTTSGGIVKKVSVVWNSNTTTGRTLNVYGINTAYSNATDLYDIATRGTSLGSIVYGTSTELNITGDYEYVGFRSSEGAMYLTSISIDWENGTPDTYSDYCTTVPTTTISITTPEGYSTFVSESAFEMPEGFMGAVAEMNGSELHWNWMYNEGDVVPANTPILVFSTETSAKANLTTGGNAPATNYLVANTTGAAAQASTLAPTAAKFYVLSYDKNDENLGFYWLTADGSSFEVPAGKVFLALPSSASARGFVLNGNTTGIKTVETVKASNVVYNLAGQRVAANTKGIVIVNGKKMLNK